ncbi:hypothetical protein SporoP37_05285 [Sporosarcina sp. P37]|nr:hypothetical protein SporoP37_05285 [Sporosarcina sp. P37]PID17427.1 hypothetical protein CSV62_13710 [Sporosarcina sp. P35]
MLFGVYFSGIIGITLSNRQEMSNPINGRHDESKLDAIMIYKIGSFGFQKVIIEYLNVSEGNVNLFKRYRK